MRGVRAKKLRGEAERATKGQPAWATRRFYRMLKREVKRERGLGGER